MCGSKASRRSSLILATDISVVSARTWMARPSTMLVKRSASASASAPVHLNGYHGQFTARLQEWPFAVGARGEALAGHGHLNLRTGVFSVGAADAPRADGDGHIHKVGRSILNPITVAVVCTSGGGPCRAASVRSERWLGRCGHATGLERKAANAMPRHSKHRPSPGADTDS
jgi:hypothetical protein